MGTANRGNKPSSGGGTAFVDGASIEADEFNTDFDNIYNEFNGNIENVNVDAAADVAPTKLGDFSATAAQMRTATDPGETGGELLSTDLTGELQRIRYAIERLSLGVGAVTNDGSPSTGYWGDFVARGSNILFNPQFQMFPDPFVATDPPLGWTANGGITFLNTQGGTQSLTITTPATDFMSYRIERPTVGQKFLIAASITATLGTTSTLSTSGGIASGSFRDFTASVPSNTSDIVYGVVESAGVNLDIEIRVGASTAGNTSVHWIGCWQVAEDFRPQDGPVLNSLTSTATQSVTTAFAPITDKFTTVFYRLPQMSAGGGLLSGETFSNGWSAHVNANISFVATSAETIVAYLDAFNLITPVTITPIVPLELGAGDVGSISLSGIFRDMAPDQGYFFRPQVKGLNGAVSTVNGTAVAETLGTTVVVTLMPPGN